MSKIDYRVIKENDLFLTTDKSGDIPADNTSGLGLFTRDTRFLSRMEFFINDEKPVLLSSSAEENYLANILLTNTHMERDGELLLWRESVEVQRTRFIYEGVLYETVRLSNFYPKTIQFKFSSVFEADYSDMFIVRGYSESTNGEFLPMMRNQRQIIYRYRGTDEVSRETSIEWEGASGHADSNGHVTFPFTLKPAESKEITFYISPVIDGRAPVKRPKQEAIKLLTESYRTWRCQTTRVKSDLASFDKLYERGLQDMRVLLTDVGHGPFPVAGLPIFAVPFGRDSLIAALQMLASNPQIAKGTLLTMAASQGSKVDLWRDEQPGKIMHEMRYGELANTNQIPFNPYYGSIDSTPLFLVLLVEYFHWTGDLKLVTELMPKIELALSWIDEYGDRDKDGFLEYYQESSKGLSNQGWKDSADSLIHENGDYAMAPIALAEVQGYVYQAKTKLAPILRLLGEDERASKLEAEAVDLKQKFNRSFWVEDLGYYAIALDGEKRQVRSITSNPGHVLMSGIVEGERAEKLAKRLVSPDLFSGYGIRTMSKRSAGFNPMSYHNGSVWPHDNSVCLMGLSKLGFKSEACTVMSGLLRASQSFEYSRFPELFCGYDSSRGYAVPYPVACSPQAWAAGTPISFLQSMLGIVPDAVDKTIRLDPVLLPGMSVLEVEQLKVGQGLLSLKIERISETACRLDVIGNSTGYRILTNQSIFSQC